MTATTATQEETKSEIPVSDVANNDDLFGHLEQRDEKIDRKELPTKRESVVMTKKQKAELEKKMDQVSILTEKLTEVETAYEQYKEDTTTEILDLKERLN